MIDSNAGDGMSGSLLFLCMLRKTSMMLMKGVMELTMGWFLFSFLGHFLGGNSGKLKGVRHAQASEIYEKLSKFYGENRL